MSKLTINETSGDFTHAVKLTYKDLQAIGNGGQSVIAVKPAFGSVELVNVAEVVPFAGTATLVIDIGTTVADPDEYIDALDVDAMTAPVSNTGDAFELTNESKAVDASNTEENIVIEVTDANIANATAGELVIGLRIIDPGRFA